MARVKRPAGRIVQSDTVSSFTLRVKTAAAKPRCKSQRYGNLKSKVRRSQSSSSSRPNHAEVRRVCRSVNTNDTDHSNDNRRWGASHRGQAINQWQA